MLGFKDQQGGCAMPLCSWFCGKLVRRVSSLEAQVAQLRAQLAAIQSSNAMALDPYVTVQTTGTPKVVFSGINVQIVNGVGNTRSINGLGNLIVGYDEDRPPLHPDYRMTDCSLGQHDNPLENEATNRVACESNGGVWAVNHKSGSHNLIVGEGHNYSSSGCVAFGVWNTVSAPGATVTAGVGNKAIRNTSSVTGGIGNWAAGAEAAVHGGEYNKAFGWRASILGGGFIQTANQRETKPVLP
jgi:hypothetical protein